MKTGFFNRLIFVLAALIVLAASLLLTVYYQDIFLLSFRDISETTNNAVNNLYHESINYIPATIGIGVGLIITIWLLVLAFRKNKTPKVKPIEYITIGTEETGQIKIAASTINNMICKNINEITGVKETKAKTTVTDGKTFVTVGISVDEGVIIPKVCEEIQTTTKEKIQLLSGMNIEQISVLVNNKA